MSLGHNNYGKAEIHVVRVDRERDRHTVTDLTVSVDLEGEFRAAHVDGDNSGLVATDSQKNIVYGLARRLPPGAPEHFAHEVASYLVGEYASIGRARIDVEAVTWDGIEPAGPNPVHAFERKDGRRRNATAVVTAAGETHLLGGVSKLALLKSTKSAFRGFLRDRWTTLAETSDRLLASSVRARWRFASAEAEFDRQGDLALEALVGAFAEHESESLQHTLHAMGEAVLEACGDIVEVRLSMPNLHHFLVDLSEVGLDNPNLVFHADDRPYGLIEGVLVRPDAPPPGSAWRGALLG